MDRETFYNSTGYIGSDSEVQNWLLFTNNAVPTVPKSDTGMKYDNGKLLYSLIPTSTTRALAEVLTFGAHKYTPNSWQTIPDGKRRYLDAAMRHLEAYRSGEAIDPESNLPHLYHLLCNVSFMIHFEDKRLNTK